MAFIELRAAAQQALEALELIVQWDEADLILLDHHIERARAAIAALRAALAEPVQEPFGYLWPTGRHPEFRFTQQKRDGVDGMPLYTAPPQRPVEPVQEPQGCDHCNHPLYAATKCRVCGRAHGIGGEG